MGDTCREIHETGFGEWGFVIYRCAYGDDEAWYRYLKYFKQAIHDKLVDQNCAFLEKYARWTVVEDEADLRAASKLRVRQRFVDWRDRNTVWRKAPEISKYIPRMPGEATLRLPRFTYCLHVDQDCLDTVDAHAAAKPTETYYHPAPMLVVALIDGDYVDLSAIDDYKCPPVEGCTEEYVGWQYMPVELLPCFYNDHHYYTLESEVYIEYSRPPKIYPLRIGSARWEEGMRVILPGEFPRQGSP
ncbi:hypothetical protein PG993_015021 [Apiospora rasikravindrae]|uniref:Uncharacterized protein n=1 Tax=Apiospora rasikravindrae TaxID=990691 RepID=A0ABR1RPL9_9PEZI